MAAAVRAAEVQAEMNRAGRPLSDMDAMIAGIALDTGHWLVTGWATTAASRTAATPARRSTATCATRSTTSWAPGPVRTPETPAFGCSIKWGRVKPSWG